MTDDLDAARGRPSRARLHLAEEIATLSTYAYGRLAMLLRLAEARAEALRVEVEIVALEAGRVAT